MQQLKNRNLPPFDGIRMRVAQMLLTKNTLESIAREAEKYGVSCTKSQLSHYIKEHPINRFERLMAIDQLEVARCRQK